MNKSTKKEHEYSNVVKKTGIALETNVQCRHTESGIIFAFTNKLKCKTCLLRENISNANALPLR